MRILFRAATAAAVACLWAAIGVAEPEIGKPAPEWALTDVAGRAHKLSDFAGKLVVLEWTNYDCPFVKKHYGTGNMQKLQERYTAQGIVWLSICSSAPGKQGHFAPEAWPAMVQERGVKATAVLLDADGTAGRAYGAKTTPHMFVIGKDGVLLYKGGIDDDASFDPKKVAGARNYVAAALDAVLEGKPVETTEAKPYGCSVKY